MSTNLAGHLLAMTATAGILLLTGPAAPAAGVDAPAEAGHGWYVAQDDEVGEQDDHDDDPDGDPSDDSGDSDRSDSSGGGSDDGTTGSAPGRDGASARPAAPPAVAAAPPVPPAPATGVVVRRTAPPPVPASLLRRPRLLSPALGRTIATRRPVLRWRHAGRGVLIYNIQVFNGGTKVMSVFSRGRAYRVPPRRLALGRRYVWRVWPYMARGSYTARPLALSWFATPPRPR